MLFFHRNTLQIEKITKFIIRMLLIKIQTFLVNYIGDPKRES